MAHTQHRNSGSSPFSSVVTLASWRLRRTWFLLLITALGMVTAVVLTCAVPLFSTITTTESLRSTLREQPDSSQLEFDMNPLGMSSRLVYDLQQQVNPIFQQSLGKYMSSPAQFALTAENLGIVSPVPTKGSAGYALHVQAALMTQSASHIRLLQGRLPHVTSDPAHEVEIMVTPDSIGPLHVHLGSVMTLSLPFYTAFTDPTQQDGLAKSQNALFKVHIVGLFTVSTSEISYWHGKDFKVYSTGSGPNVTVHYSMLFPAEGLFGMYDGLGKQYHIDVPFSTFGNTLSWYYNLDAQRISVTQLNDLISRVANVKTIIDTRYANSQSYYGYGYDPFNPPLLLALATAFALFSLVYTASQEQHVYDVAASQVGADFSGTIPTQQHLYIPSLQDENAVYTSIAGVTSASAGFAGIGNVAGGTLPLNIDVQAVDTQTFAQSALWPSEASTQTLPALLSLLDAKRNDGITNNVVPVIVDATVQSKLALHLGSTFTAEVNPKPPSDPLPVSDLPCVVVGIVQTIPTADSSAVGIDSPYYTPTGGMLLDFRTYNAFYTQKIKTIVGANQALPVNYVWLRTTNDAAQLTSVRSVLTNDLEKALVNLNDRRAIIATLQADPLTLTLLGILSIGTGATLLLAIVGDLLASWLSARARLTNFAVLRALGTSPRQVASVLTWEQALIYIVGVLLGLAFGLVLANTVSPTLINNSSSLQQRLPTHLVLPVSLLVALLALVVIFVFALGMMIRIVSRPSMSQTLRLNED